MQTIPDERWQKIDLAHTSWRDLVTDHILIDLSPVARAAQIPWPVLVTRDCYRKHFLTPPALMDIQTDVERFHQLMTLLRVVLRGNMGRLLVARTITMYVHLALAPQQTQLTKLAVHWVTNPSNALVISEYEQEAKGERDGG